MSVGDIVLVAGAVLAGLAAAYTGLVSLLARRRQGRVKARPLEEGLSVAVIIAAYNEPLGLLRELFDSLTRLEPKPRKVVLAWDGRSASVEELEELGEVLNRAGIEYVVDYSPVPRRKAGALNSAARKAGEECLVVLDVGDEPGEPAYLSLLAANNCNTVSQWVPRAPSNVFEEAVAAVLEHASSTLYRARASLGLPVLFLGSGSSTPRSLALRLGGWDTSVLLEDLEYGLRLILSGNRPSYSPVPTLIGLPPTYTGFRKQQERWSRGAGELLRIKLGEILRSSRLNALEKVELILYLSQYLTATLWPHFLLAGLLLPHTRIAADLAGIVGIAVLAVNGLAASQTLSKYRHGLVARTRLGGGMAALSSTLAPRLLAAFLQGLLGIRSEWVKTPKTRTGRGSSYAPELLYSALVLAAIIASTALYSASIASLLLALYGLAPLYVYIRYHDYL